MNRGPATTFETFSGAIGAAALTSGIGLAVGGLVTIWRTDLGVSKPQGLLLVLAGLSLLTLLLILAIATSIAHRAPGMEDPLVSVLHAQRQYARSTDARATRTTTPRRARST